MAEIAWVKGLDTAGRDKAFGDEDGLYEAAPAHRRAHAPAPRCGMLTGSPDLRKAWRFPRAVVAEAAREDRRGRLLTRVRPGAGLRRTCAAPDAEAAA